MPEWEEQVQPEEARRFERILRQADDEVNRIVSEMERLHRVTAELEIARALVCNAAARRQWGT